VGRTTAYSSGWSRPSWGTKLTLSVLAGLWVILCAFVVWRFWGLSYELR
jgi:hypothetical protein